MVLNIEDKNPADYPQGIIYKLRGELIIPQIDATDITSIFEEHRIVRNLSSFQHMADVRNCLVYDEFELY
jgi:hydrocephalus-inducing protein